MVDFITVRYPLEWNGRTIHVHGTSARAQFMGDEGGGVDYDGYGMTVTARNQRTWAHFSLPVASDWTERILDAGEPDEDLATVVEVGVETIPDECSLDAVHLFDGIHRFAAWDRTPAKTGKLPKGMSFGRHIGTPLVPGDPKSGKPGDPYDLGIYRMRWELIYRIRDSLGVSIAFRHPSSSATARHISAYARFE